MPYAILLKTPAGHFIAAERNGTVRVTDSPEQSIEGQEASYNEFHNRGYEASMSACMHYIQFGPVVVQLPDSEVDVIEMIEGTKLYSLISIAGHAYGWKVKPELVEWLINTSAKIRLISEDTYKHKSVT